MPCQPPATRLRAQSRDGPGFRSPIRRARCGSVRTGAVRGRGGWCVQADAPDERSPLRGRPDQPRRRATSSASGGFDRSRPDRIGRPSARAWDGRPRNAHRRVVPREAELVAAVELVRHEVQQLQRFDGQEAVRDADRDRDALVRPELAGLHDGPRPAAVQQRPDVDERDERVAAGDDPVVDLAAVEVEAAQHAGGGRRQVGLDERLGQPAAAPQLAEAASLVGMALDRAVGDAGDRRPGHRAGRPPPAAVSRNNSGA